MKKYKKKLKIFPYYKRFPKVFEKGKNRISKAVKGVEIHHIGSTAVPGLGGKGIIDIMIGIKNWKEAKEIIKKLESIGFKHLHPKETGRIFLSKHRKPTLDNFRIHIVIKGNKPYKDTLALRDYLRKNRKEIKRLFKLKLKWLKETKGDRTKYFKLKEGYIKEILKRLTPKK